MGALTERLSVIIDSTAGGAIRELEKLAGQAEKAGVATGQTAGALEKLGVSSKSAGTAAVAGYAALAFGAGAAFEVVKHGIEVFQEYGSQALEIQHLTGGTAQEASGLAATFRLLGIDVDSSSKPLGLFGANLAKSAETLVSYGGQVVKNADGTTNLIGTLDNLRKTFQETTDATQRDLLAKTELGRGYQTLLPYLDATDEQLRAIHEVASQTGQILSQSDIDKARELAINTAALKSEWRGVEEWVGKATASLESKFLRGLHLIAGFVETGSISGAMQFANNIDDAAQAEGRLKTEAQAATDALIKQSQAEEQTAGIVQGLMSAEKSLADGRKAIVTDTKAVADAQQNLNDLLSKSRVDLDQVRSATLGVASANLSASEAAQTLINAQKALNDLLAGPTAGEKEDASISLAQALLSQKQAAQSVTDAVQAKNDAMAKGDAPGLAKAELEYQSALLGVRSAAREVEKAHDAETALMARNKDGSQDLISAKDNLARAQLGVQQAAESQHTASVALQTAEAGDLSLTKQIRTAKDQLKTAEDNLAGAQANLGNLEWNLVQAQDKLNANIDAAPAGIAKLSSSLDPLIAKYPELRSIQDVLNGIAAAAHAADVAAYNARVDAGFAQLPGGPGGRQSADPAASGLVAPTYPYGGAKTSGYQLVDVPVHAAGGIIPATPGGSIHRLGEGGWPEVVASTDPALRASQMSLLARAGFGTGSGGTGQTIHVTLQMDHRTVGEVVIRDINSRTHNGGSPLIQ